MEAAGTVGRTSLGKDGSPEGPRKLALEQAVADAQRRLARLILKSDAAGPRLRLPLGEHEDADRLAAVLAVKIRDLRLELEALRPPAHPGA